MKISIGEILKLQKNKHYKLNKKQKKLLTVWGNQPTTETKPMEEEKPKKRRGRPPKIHTQEVKGNTVTNDDPIKE